MSTTAMVRNQNFISSEATKIIKGVALIFMFIHHFFTFPDWYVEGISYPSLQGFATYFNTPFKLCVPIFAFLTGFFYYYNKDKTYRYAFRKSTDLWLNYVITFFMLLIPAILLGCYELSVSKLLLEALALYTPVMIFCWYVTFYIMAIFALPSFARLTQKSAVLSFMVAAVVPVLLANMVKPLSDGYIGGLFYDLMEQLKWFSCVAMGYIFAQNGMFEKMNQVLRIKNIALKIIVYLLFMVVPFIARGYDTSYDWLYAPMFIFGLVNLINSSSKKTALFPLALIGKYSLSMWFVHGVFFNVCKEYTQWILYLPKTPFLVLIWGLMICLIVSIIIMVPINCAVKWKNRMLEGWINRRRNRSKS